MIYTVEQIRAAVAPIAKKYNLRAVYLFGSYARGTAGEASDIDLVIDTEGTDIKGLFALGAVYCDFEAALQKNVDVITVNSIEQPARLPSEKAFRETVHKERVMLYSAA